MAALGAQLATQNTIQEQQKGSGIEGGQPYIGLQNALYAYGQQVSSAAETFYASNPARRQLFDFTTGTPPAARPVA